MHIPSTCHKIQDGVFGAAITKNNQPIYLRMEQLTPENTKNWSQFKAMSTWVANDVGGLFGSLVNLAGTSNYPSFEKFKNETGFTKEEYSQFTEKAIKLKNKIHNIANILKDNSAGCGHMRTLVDGQNYIVYATTNPHFSIQDIEIARDQFTLKKFMEIYSDILITVGSNFSATDYIYYRGISRNPHWVFEEKFSGLAMLILAFGGAIADQHFPEKREMRVKPLGSMQCILKKHLLPGEGYIERNGEKIDITNLQVSPEEPEGDLSYIKISALVRIFNELIHPQTS